MKPEDGVYLFYVKDGKVYPTVMNEDQWNMLQFLASTITGGEALKVVEQPMGDAIYLVNKK